MRSQAHDSILRVLSVDRDRDDNATIKLFEPLIADAKTSDRRRFLVSAFKRLGKQALCHPPAWTHQAGGGRKQQ